MFGFNADSSSQFEGYHIRDIQSQNYETSQYLCTSFEGLMKKQQIQYPTRHTEWTEQEKKTLESSKLLVSDQNQKQKEKKQHFTTIWKFNDNLEQNQNNKDKESILKAIQLQKQSIISLRNQKIKRFRKLLPYYCTNEIPQSIKQMIKIAERIDRYLYEKKEVEFIDNIHNIINSLFHEQQMSSMWSKIRKIMYITDEYYKIRVDPLKNLCLGFGSKKDHNLRERKQKFRKKVVDYYLTHKDEVQKDEIPENYVQPTKSTKFYPQNLNITFKQSEKNNLIKSSFVNSLKQSVSLKQMQLEQQTKSIFKFAGPEQQQKKIFNQNLPETQIFKSFCNIISSIYTQKMVAHMYKVSLIKSLRITCDLPLQKMFYFLRYILEEGLFLEVKYQNKCQILKINQNQKDKLIEILKKKKEAI